VPPPLRPSQPCGSRPAKARWTPPLRGRRCQAPGPKLHVHPYDEVFVVHEGEATFTVGDEAVATRGGQIVVARREIPHRFENSGSGRLRLTAIHPNEHTIGRWVNGR
jgi:mannose-6-phosphate isomerase-like protein (cupin superfamily)